MLSPRICLQNLGIPKDVIEAWPPMLQVLDLSTTEGDNAPIIIIAAVHAVHSEGCMHGLYPMRYQKKQFQINR